MGRTQRLPGNQGEGHEQDGEQKERRTEGAKTRKNGVEHEPSK